MNCVSLKLTIEFFRNTTVLIELLAHPESTFTILMDPFFFWAERRRGNKGSRRLKKRILYMIFRIKKR